MSKTDVHLAYQQETGLSLHTIQDNRTDLDYVDWLEEKLEGELKINHKLAHLLRKLGNHIFGENKTSEILKNWST